METFSWEGEWKKYTKRKWKRNSNIQANSMREYFSGFKFYCRFMPEKF